MRRLETPADGPRFDVETPLDQIEAAASGSDVLILNFPAFRDGRGFSLASTLRDRGYAGRLVASGHLLPDQARHLQRSGFDAVELAPGADPAEWDRMAMAFSAAYQPAADTRPTIWRRRREVAGV